LSVISIGCLDIEWAVPLIFQTMMLLFNSPSISSRSSLTIPSAACSTPGPPNPLSVTLTCDIKIEVTPIPERTFFSWSTIPLAAAGLVM
jgi:hypothetical protein